MTEQEPSRGLNERQEKRANRRPPGLRSSVLGVAGQFSRDRTSDHCLPRNSSHWTRTPSCRTLRRYAEWSRLMVVEAVMI